MADCRAGGDFITSSQAFNIRQLIDVWQIKLCSVVLYRSVSTSSAFLALHYFTWRTPLTDLPSDAVLRLTVCWLQCWCSLLSVSLFSVVFFFCIPCALLPLYIIHNVPFIFRMIFVHKPLCCIGNKYRNRFGIFCYGFFVYLYNSGSFISWCCLLASAIILWIHNIGRMLIRLRQILY